MRDFRLAVLASILRSNSFVQASGSPTLIPFHRIYPINTFVGAYRCTPLQSIHLLQRFLEKVLNGKLFNSLSSISLSGKKQATQISSSQILHLFVSSVRKSSKTHPPTIYSVLSDKTPIFLGVKVSF